VHIVEWVNEDDRQTGHEVFAEIEPLGKGCEPQVPVAYHPISTAGELLGLLHALEQEYAREPRKPVLHLETHGAKDGIEARGETISWRDLAGALVPLNRATRLNLVVILAACEGFYGTTMLRPNLGQAPFRGLIGPNRKVSDRELLRGSVAFYGTLFRRLDGDRAIKAMNDVVDPTHETFWHVSAETAFMLAYRSYLETQSSPEAVASRADGIAQRVAARIEAHRGVPVSPDEVEALRRQAQTLIAKHDAYDHFAIERRRFFYIDEFPENDRRFDFTRDDCLPDKDTDEKSD
jgi:hypothetical protein